MHCMMCIGQNCSDIIITTMIILACRLILPVLGEGFYFRSSVPPPVVIISNIKFLANVFAMKLLYCRVH